MPPRKQPS
jgi:hypothetical protein